MGTVIKCGIVGLGQVARVRHVEAYRRDARCEVVVAYDPDPQRADLARKLNIPFFTTDLETLVAQKPEVVSVCSPPFAHAQNVHVLLKAGIHVLVEKPMAMTETECLAMHQAAKQAGVKLCVAHNFLFGRSMAVLNQAQASGRLGDVTGVSAVQWSSWNRDLPPWHPTLKGGLFFDEIPHFLYLMESVLGPLDVAHTWAQSGGPDGTRHEWRGDATLKGTHGFGSLTAWFGAPQSEWYLAVGGTRGTVVMDLFRDIAVVLPYEARRDYRYILEVPTRATAQRWQRIMQWIGKRVFKGRHLYGHEALIAQWITSIVEDTPVPVPPQAGTRVLALMDAIFDAGKEGFRTD